MMICLLAGKVYELPRDRERVKVALQELNALLIGGSYMQGRPDSWFNYYPPSAVAFVYEQLDNGLLSLRGTLQEKDFK